ncbi:unnamed protein product [Auanema sp. JU1783]|nr:unnamed protein product [Auanema sp. JU1783]
MSSNSSLYTRRRHAEEDLFEDGVHKKLRLEIPTSETKYTTLNDSGIGNSPSNNDDVEMMDEVEVARAEKSPARKDMVQVFPVGDFQTLNFYNPSMASYYGYTPREYRFSQ